MMISVIPSPDVHQAANRPLEDTLYVNGQNENCSSITADFGTNKIDTIYVSTEAAVELHLYSCVMRTTTADMQVV